MKVCLTSPTLFFAMSYFAHHKNKFETMEAPPKYKILLKDGVLAPLAQLYRWEGEEFGQTIWD
jgi:hypothetical protein